MDDARWRRARDADFDGLRELLLTRESAWVGLIDRLLANPAALPRDFYLLERRSPGRRFEACFYLSESGMAMVAARPGAPEGLAGPQLVRLCRRRLAGIFCLMGCAEHVAALLQLLPRLAIATTRYDLMGRPPPRPGSLPGYRCQWPIADGGVEWRQLRLRRADPGDTDALFELQVNYEIEEVLVAGHSLNPDTTRRQLAASLARQCVWCAGSGPSMVAKAGSNACAWGHVQIGGVYALPAWRNRGVAEELMKGLLRDIFSAGYGACLFVKQSNAPARRLYDKLGFEPGGELIISYF